MAEKPVSYHTCACTSRACSLHLLANMPVNQMRILDIGQSYRERTHEGYACVECSMAEGIKQRAGHCHKGHANAHKVVSHWICCVFRHISAVVSAVHHCWRQRA
eukprot:365965-Chlamydomonas_euryale.AAC.7